MLLIVGVKAMSLGGVGVIVFTPFVLRSRQRCGGRLGPAEVPFGITGQNGRLVADFGEVGVAVVIAKPGEVIDPVAIIRSLKSRLANFKIPKRCYVVNELPRNAMGKVQKNVLRQQYRSPTVS